LEVISSHSQNNFDDNVTNQQECFFSEEQNFSKLANKNKASKNKRKLKNTHNIITTEDEEPKEIFLGNLENIFINIYFVFVYTEYYNILNYIFTEIFLYSQISIVMTALETLIMK